MGDYPIRFKRRSDSCFDSALAVAEEPITTEMVSILDDGTKPSLLYYYHVCRVCRHECRQCKLCNNLCMDCMVGVANPVAYPAGGAIMVCYVPVASSGRMVGPESFHCQRSRASIKTGSQGMAQAVQQYLASKYILFGGSLI